MKRFDVGYLLEIALSLPKTVFFNLRYLPLRMAMFMPFFIHYRTRVTVRNGSVKIIDGRLRPFMIKFCNRGSRGIAEQRYNSLIIEGGQVSFYGSASFGAGSSIRASGDLRFGSNFNANRNTFISCTNNISFGDNVLLGWNVSIRDSDGHTLIDEGERQPTIGSVKIGSHVWICAESHILKGVCLGNDCVLGYKSLLTSGSNENGVLWVGHPAKIVKRGISWDSSAWDV